MEELFRFSVIRAADRHNAQTVSLERTAAPTPQQDSQAPIKAYRTFISNTRSFQDQLREQVQSLTSDKNSSPDEIWKQLEPIAIDFLISQANIIFANSLWTSLQDFLNNLNNLVLNGTGDAKTTSAISSLFDKQGAQKNSDTFTSYLYDLGDLFIALLIIRRGGPNNLDSIIRSQSPPLWDLTELLSDKPTLQEISDRINAIALIQAGYAALSPPATAKTAADIQSAIQTAFQKAINKTLILPRGIFAPFQKPIHGIGLREFHVVKQHIRGYELDEIAKIENILKGESRDHSTKHTLTNETTTFSQTVSTTESTKELDSTDHTNIQNETQDQVKEDTKVDAGVHASYDGGSYKIQADLTVAYDKSSDSTKKFASDVSKDVTQKATTKVTQQVTQSQTVQITETFEEDEDHTFDNRNGTAHISGVYQWINKVYLAQTFNLGRHLVFDMMVPEPAANLLALATIRPANQTIPVQPDPLEADESTGLPANPVPTAGTNPLRPEHLKDPTVANKWIAKYQVTGVDPQPASQLTFPKSYALSAGSAPANIVSNDTIQLDDGYCAATADVIVAWEYRAPEHGTYPPILNIQVGTKNLQYTDKTSKSNYQDGSPNLQLNSEQKSVGVTITSNFINQASVEIEITCFITPELLAGWQLKTYEKIIAAWQTLQSDYKSKTAALQLQATTVGPLGAADPDANRLTERVELKRNCIAIIDHNNTTVSGVNYGSGASVQEFPQELPLPGPPGAAPDPTLPQLPEPDLDINPQVGPRVRWFEQAFEWENMAYIFYPYYWGRRSTWLEGLNLKNDDPLFLNFLQAGYARVVVPVRLGFEKAVHFYLHTGLPWLGGGLPSIGDKTQNPLYLDIAEEIKAITGGGEPNETETPIGDPWDIKLPTTLIKLRKDDLVPSWNRIGANLKPDTVNYPSDPPVGDWTWSEEEKPKILPYTTS
ncbi:MAG TPA: hypothetical protein VIM16_19575 [Mucilaginibacter sp.]|jgi:hypothetical protein